MPTTKKPMTIDEYQREVSDLINEGLYCIFDAICAGDETEAKELATRLAGLISDALKKPLKDNYRMSFASHLEMVELLRNNPSGELSDDEIDTTLDRLGVDVKTLPFCLKHSTPKVHLPGMPPNTFCCAECEKATG